MDARLLGTLFGREQKWHGPCVVIVGADAAIQMTGNDSVQGGGSKSYAPRSVSGRIHADAACLLQDGSALVLLQMHKLRSATGEESVRHTLSVVGTSFVVAVEFADAAVLAELGLPVPAPSAAFNASVTQVRPRPR